MKLKVIVIKKLQHSWFSHTSYSIIHVGRILCARHEIDEFNEEKPFFEEEQLEEAETVDLGL